MENFVKISPETADNLVETIDHVIMLEYLQYQVIDLTVSDEDDICIFDISDSEILDLEEQIVEKVDSLKDENYYSPANESEVLYESSESELDECENIVNNVTENSIGNESGTRNECENAPIANSFETIRKENQNIPIELDSIDQNSDQNLTQEKSIQPLKRSTRNRSSTTTSDPTTTTGSIVSTTPIGSMSISAAIDKLIEKPKANESIIQKEASLMNRIQRAGISHTSTLPSTLKPEFPKPKCRWSALLNEITIKYHQLQKHQTLKSQYRKKLTAAITPVLCVTEKEQQKMAIKVSALITNFWKMIRQLVEIHVSNNLEMQRRDELRDELEELIQSAEYYALKMKKRKRIDESDEDEDCDKHESEIEEIKDCDENVENANVENVENVNDENSENQDNSFDEDSSNHENSDIISESEISSDSDEDLLNEASLSIDQLKQKYLHTEPSESSMSTVSSSSSSQTFPWRQRRHKAPNGLKIPFLLHGRLREYQELGLEWLVKLYENNLNGILADQMGLGKTIQTIALLSYLACEREEWGPHLIIVPSSVLLNWEMEFKKWCPAFKVLAYYGKSKERKEKRIGWNSDLFHVCITSYQIAVQDQAILKRKRWQYMILDEAHNIKNALSQRWQTLVLFPSEHRLLLTGTPLQNNIMELWSLMHFLMPFLFKSHEAFQKCLQGPISIMMSQNTVDKLLIKRLHSILEPFVLRRLKKQVETQLPAKIEHLVFCPLSTRQRFLYDEYLARGKTKDTLSSTSFLDILACLMALRKVCNHPDLFEERIVSSPLCVESVVRNEYPKFFIIETESIPLNITRFTSLASYSIEYIRNHSLNVLLTLPLLEKFSSDGPKVTNQVIARYQRVLSRKKYSSQVIDRYNRYQRMNKMTLLSLHPPIASDAIRCCTIPLPRIPLSVSALEEYHHFQIVTRRAILHKQGQSNFVFPDKRLLQYDCGKLVQLDPLLRRLHQGRHRVLIYTQMSKMLDILEQFLALHGYLYLRLDGRTSIEQRQRLILRFNHDSRIFCFILSTRSGGIGINLTGADTVIFYDSDWNPATDAQAQDRCHRIGQTKDVHIYRLVSLHTIEENILTTANQKRVLDAVVMDRRRNGVTMAKGMDQWKDLFNVADKDKWLIAWNQMEQEEQVTKGEEEEEEEDNDKDFEAFDDNVDEIADYLTAIQIKAFNMILAEYDE